MEQDLCSCVLASTCHVTQNSRACLEEMERMKEIEGGESQGLRLFRCVCVCASFEGMGIMLPLFAPLTTCPDYKFESLSQ